MTLVKFKNGNYTDRMFNKMLSPMFSDVFNDFFNQGINGINHRLPAVNISESAEAFKIELAAPGLSKDDFKINLEKDVISISTEKKQEAKEENSQYTRKEFSYHSFKRSFTLPENANKEEIRAEYKDGVLHISIAKVKATQELVKEISVQ